MKKKIIIAIPLVIVVLLVSTAVYGYTSLIGSIKQGNLPASDEELGIPAPSGSPGQTDKVDNVRNIALFGLDTNTSDIDSRSDLIIVLSVHKESGDVRLASFLKEMIVPIPGTESDRINAAYVSGGPTLAVKTLNTNFDLNIRDYISLDFFSLEKAIDRAGGVDVTISDIEAKILNDYLEKSGEADGQENNSVQSGVQTLNGKQALAYARLKYVGAGYDKTDRQTTVLKALFHKFGSMGILKQSSVLSDVFPLVETSMPKAELVNLIKSCLALKPDQTRQMIFPADGTYTTQSHRGKTVLEPEIDTIKEQIHEFIYGGI